MLIAKTIGIFHFRQPRSAHKGFIKFPIFYNCISKPFCILYGFVQHTVILNIKRRITKVRVTLDVLHPDITISTGCGLHITADIKCRYLPYSTQLKEIFNTSFRFYFFLSQFLLLKYGFINKIALRI